jgi:hypothetical protein
MRFLASTITLICLTSFIHASASTLKCINGFTNQETVIPDSRINDGYCDCIDGSDEWLTDACAGSQSWAGSGEPQNEIEDHNRYNCPQQKTMLPLSRMHDGICDCCDGSDEPVGHCDDVCDVVLAEERRAKAELLQKFQVGEKKLKTEGKMYRQIVKNKMAKISELEAQIAPLQRWINDKSVNLKKEKDSVYRSHRLATVAMYDRVRSSSKVVGKLLGKDSDFMVEFIAASCQLYGESKLAKAKHNFNKDNFCMPLKLAALDIGLLLDDSNSKIGIQDEVIDEFLARDGLLDVVEEEWVDPEDEILDHASRYGDGNYYDDDENEDFDHYGYDDDEEPPAARVQEMRREEEKRRKRRIDHQNLASDGKDINGEYKAKFSAIMRSTFLEEARELQIRIDTLLEENNQDDDQSDTDDDDQSGPEEDAMIDSDADPLANERDVDEIVENSDNIDPMAIQMLRNSLTTKMGQVNHGDDLARSAKKALQSLKENLDEKVYLKNLEQLVIGVINLSLIGEADVEEIITVINADVDEDSCFALYNVLCTDGMNHSDSLAKRCVERAGVQTCEVPTDGSVIPVNIHDGYYNYFVPKSRGPDDLFTELFSGYNSKIYDGTNVMALKEEIEEAKKDMDKSKVAVKNAKEEVGVGTDENDAPKFGKSGELYAIRDECFEVEVGKYTYELCMFGKAYQREGGKKKSGTDLGKWQGYSTVESSASHVWEWKNGAKCWNGPKRSATAFVTCGAETKLISADEPNICEYEFRMESHIACDSKFKALHDL